MGHNYFDLIIKNGIIIDGTGNPWYKADIGINGDTIKRIGNLDIEAKSIIQAEGLTITPGFIDTHSHSDLMLIAEPEAKQKIMQGVTTEIVGQDGLGEAPIREDLVHEWRKYLSGLNGDPDIDWSWRSFGDYLNVLEMAKPSINVFSLVGHGNIRFLVMGMENRQPDTSELEEMKKLLEDSMREGAFGFSTGLIYPPCVYADTEELVELCKVTKRYNGVFVVHMRNEGDKLLESIEEVAAVGRRSNIPVHISHFKAQGRRNWDKMKEAIEKIQEARRDGLDITVDQYPYIAGSTFLSSLLPVWVHEGGTKKMLSRLKDLKFREKIADEMSKSGRGRDWGWNNVLVTSVKTRANKKFEGMWLHEVAGIRGQEPVETILDIVLEEDNAATMAGFSMSEVNVKMVMRTPFQMVCTDGIIMGRPHPRVYGSFPRVLGKYVREEKVLRLEEAVRKMTSLPAQRFGLLRRGVIRPGMYADIAVINPGIVKDSSTFKNPIRYPEGIIYVIVNGCLTVDKGKHTGNKAGVVIRNKTA
jgi:N-acyl-D-amino-acid deacylase